MSENNALERLLKKQKPKVPPRTDALEESISHDVKTQRQQDSSRNRETEAIEPSNLTSPDSETLKQQNEPMNLNNNPSDSIGLDVKMPLLQDFETVRNTIRIESSVDEALRQLCHDNRITKETWLEAAYLYLSEHPEALTEVVKQARERLQQRKAIADYKRAKTMQERFLS